MRTLALALARDDISGAAGKAKSYDALKKAFADFLFRGQKLEVFKSPGLGQFSKPEECERDFRVRLQQAAREQRDEISAKLKEKYAPKLAALQERIRKAEQAVEKQKEQANQSKLSTAISFGATVFGAIMGRKAVSATTGMCRVRASFFRRRVASQPSRPGKDRSIRITSGKSSNAFSSASSPFFASALRNPETSRYSAYISRASW